MRQVQIFQISSVKNESLSAESSVIATLTQLHNTSNASCDVTDHMRGKWACVVFFAHLQKLPLLIISAVF